MARYDIKCIKCIYITRRGRLKHAIISLKIKFHQYFFFWWFPVLFFFNGNENSEEVVRHFRLMSHNIK